MSRRSSHESQRASPRTSAARVRVSRRIARVRVFSRRIARVRVFSRKIARVRVSRNMQEVR
ncbi:MAG: hypothetical protein ACRDQ5_09015 [Sciscionella sp.]